jgi:hypothetical protein
MVLSGIRFDSDCRSKNILIGKLTVHQLPALLGKGSTLHYRAIGCRRDQRFGP